MKRTVKVIQKGITKVPIRKRVAAYARVSSGKDAMIHSLSAQVSYYSHLIQNNNEWNYVGVYADEAVTGTKDNREQFNNLLDDCRNGKVDMIITKSISRFARNTVTMLETVRELKELNVDVFFEKENIHSMSGDGELMLTILASFSQEESRSVSENCKWRIRKGFEQGELINLRFIYGYRIEKGKIEIYEEEAKIVRMIFQDYLDGYGCTVIAKKLRGMHVKKLSKDHLTKKLIKNKGTVPQYYAEETHPAIIDSETFKRAQEIMKANRIKYKCEPGKKSYTFTSKIQCGICGKNYRHKDRSGRSTWVCCNHHKYGNERCIAKPIYEERLINLLNEILEINEFQEDIFNKAIDKIKIEENRSITVIFKNGNVIKKGMV